MSVHDLKQKFFEKKQYISEDVNELLDFAKKAYIHNEIDLQEYKQIVRELESQGAKIPSEVTSI